MLLGIHRHLGIQGLLKVWCDSPECGFLSQPPQCSSSETPSQPQTQSRCRGEGTGSGNQRSPSRHGCPGTREPRHGGNDSASEGTGHGAQDRRCAAIWQRVKIEA